MSLDFDKVSIVSEPANQCAAISADTGQAYGAGRTYTPNGFLDTLFNDTVDLVDYTLIRALYIGVAGNIKFQDWDGNIVGPVAVSQGNFSFRPKRIYATGTTVTQVIGAR